MSRTLRISALGLLSVGLMGSVALAATNPPTGGGGYGYGYSPAPKCKPGWGFGDKNHCHSGPPGLVNKLDAHRPHGKPFQALVTSTSDPATSTNQTGHAKSGPRHQDTPNLGTSTTTGAPHHHTSSSTTTSSTTSSSTTDPTTSTSNPGKPASTNHASQQGKTHGGNGNGNPHGH